MGLPLQLQISMLTFYRLCLLNLKALGLINNIYWYFMSYRNGLRHDLNNTL